MKRNNLKKMIIVPTVFVMSAFSFSQTALAVSDVNESTNNTYTSENITIEILDGNEKNWQSIKVIDTLNGTTEYVKKEILNGKEIYKIYSEDGQQTNEVVSESGVVSVNGEEVPLSEGKEIPAITTYGNQGGSGFYLISTIKSSYSANFNTAATCASLLSALFAAPVGIFVTVASAIVSAKIKQIWYTQYKYSDKKAYHPTTKMYRQFYKDPARTQYVGYAEYIY